MILEGILGLVGGLIPKGIELFQKKEDQRHELKLLEMQMRIGQQETEKAQISGELEAFKESYKLDVGLGGASQWVQNINAFVRPGITLYLVICVSIIAITNYDASITRMAMDNLMSLTAMAVGWYFGARGIEKMK